MQKIVEDYTGGKQMTELTEFGKELKSVLKEKGMTQTELAKELEISNTSLWKYVTLRNPPIERIRKMESILGISLEKYYGKPPKKAVSKEAFILSNNIKYKLKEKEMTTREFSELSGIPIWTAERCLKGEVNPNIIVLKRISEALEISLDSLLDPDYIKMQEEEIELKKIIEPLKKLPMEKRRKIARSLLFE